MSDYIKIAALHLFMLAVQVFYMYLSSKDQLKEHRNLYILAIPVAMAVPVLAATQSGAAYSLYEYSIVFCMIFAACADSMIACFADADTMRDSWRRYLCAYLAVCAVSFCLGKAAAAGAVAAVLLLAFAAFSFVRKSLSARDLLRAAVLAAASVACSWMFVDLVL